MKRTIILVLTLVYTIDSIGQSIKEIDSISKDFCEYLKTTEHIDNDSIRLDEFYKNKFDTFLYQFDREKSNLIGSQLFYRTQKNCRAFTELLERLYPPKESVSRIKEKPKTKLSDKQILDFWNQKSFYYFENSGEETIVVIENNEYKETFTDSSYSNLSYERINKFEFELEFLESNNEIRRNFSLRGDKFIYGIIDREENYYLISTKIENQNYYELFKLYFE